MNFNKRVNGSWVDIPHYIHNTSTDTITTFPAVLYPNATTATVGLKGNTVQNGTPSPQNPVMPEGTGERTGNLFDGTKIEAGRINSETGIVEYASGTSALSFADETVTISTSVAWRGFVTDFISTQEYLKWSYVSDTIMYGYEFAYDENKEFLGAVFLSVVPTGTKYIRISFQFETTVTNAKIKNIMLNSGSTALPYEPYGYKIPISSGGVTTNIYLGSTQTVRQIYKYVCTGEENWNNNFGVSLFGVQNLLNSRPFIPRVQAYCTHCIYNPVQSGIDANTHNGDIVLQQSGGSGYNVFIKNTDYTTNEDFKAWLATEYANGTPVTIWYVLATAVTAAVNEPLMKIGTYADTLSNAASIPTTEGANSITVDTTVQPSEFTATWTGWHDAEVKEKSENLWNESYTGIMQNTITYLPLNVGDGDYTLSSTVSTEGQAAVLFLLSGNVSTGASTVNNGVWNGQSRTVTAVDGYVTIGYRKYTEANPENANTMLNTGSTALPYEPYWK